VRPVQLVVQVLQVLPDQTVSRVPRELLAQVADQDSPACLERQEELDHKVRRVLKGPLVHPGRLGLREAQDRLEAMVLRERVVQQDLRAPLARRGQRELPEALDRRELLDRQVSQVCLGQPVQLVPPELQEARVRLEQMAPRVQLVLLDHLVLRVVQVLQVCQVLQVEQVRLVQPG